MIYLRQQRTISQPARVDGFGYWSGRDVTLEFRPAAANTGLVFVRADLDPPQRIAARIAHRIDASRRTTLAHQGTTVEMVEHVMAALGGLQIDNCEIWVDQPEMPGCDGSSLPFVEALRAGGIVQQQAPQPKLVVTQTVRAGQPDCWVELRPAACDGLLVDYLLHYPQSPAIGCQQLELAVTPNAFCQQLAAARTFLLEEEARWLRQQGLGARVRYEDVLVFDQTGPIQNTLRFPDECVRHKTLDLIGDLTLAGCDIVGRCIAHRSGHRQNAQLVAKLLAEGQIVHALKKTA